MQACQARTNKLPYGRKEDLAKTFIAEAPIHIINNTTIKETEAQILNNPDREETDDFYLCEE